MNASIVDRTISALCLEVEGKDEASCDWRSLSEEELLQEACVCMFSSQMVFEVAEAAAQRVKDLGFLRAPSLNEAYSGYERDLASALSKPLAVKWNGRNRSVRPRFKNRLASLLAKTVKSMREKGLHIRTLLASSTSDIEARELLVINVCGFGPKQASLYLRRIGYSAQLAVLDTHVLDYLRLTLGIDPKPYALSKLPTYETIEEEFQQVAVRFGHSVGCVDLAIWVAMRVAKREAIL